MARPRTFDPADALDAALEVFRTRGYEATSVQDLVDATGLSRSSLYAAFGDKHGLFLAALDRYAATGRQSLDALCRCGETSPLGALRAHLTRITAEPADGDLPPPGCLMTNAAVEVASRDPETARRAGAARRAMADAFERLVREAQAAGETDAGRDPAALAQFLTGTVFGLHALKKAGAPPAALADVVDTAVSAVAGA